MFYHSILLVLPLIWAFEQRYPCKIWQEIMPTIIMQRVPNSTIEHKKEIRWENLVTFQALVCVALISNWVYLSLEQTTKRCWFWKPFALHRWSFCYNFSAFVCGKNCARSFQNFQHGWSPSVRVAHARTKNSCFLWFSRDGTLK